MLNLNGFILDIQKTAYTISTFRLSLNTTKERKKIKKVYYNMNTNVIISILRKANIALIRQSSNLLQIVRALHFVFVQKIKIKLNSHFVCQKDLCKI